VKVTKSRDVSADKNAITRHGHINFKLSGNYRRWRRRVWYSFNVSRSNKPEVEIWRTFRILNAKIYVKRHQIAEVLHLNRKSGSASRTAVSKFTPDVIKSPFLCMRSANIADSGHKCD